MGRAVAVAPKTSAPTATHQASTTSPRGVQRGATLETLVEDFLREGRVPTPWYIIAPEGNGRTVWDTVVLMLVLLSAVSIPGQLAFGNLMPDDLSAALTHFHTALLVVYGFDLVLWLFTAFEDDSGELAIKLDRIVANYLRTWLIVDLIAVVPWPLGASAPGLPHVPVFAMLKVLRLSRVLSNKVGSSFGITSIAGVLMRFSRMFVGMFLLVHWFACTFYAVGCIYEEGTIYEEDSHLSRLAALAPGERYVMELYNALSMMLGERLDGEPDARRAAVAMVAMLTGALVVAAVFGNVAVLITSINMSKTRLQEKMDRINESMKSCRLPLELQAVIRQYYLYSWARHKESAGQAFVEDLSDGLRRKVRLALYRDVLVAVPIFKPLGEAELEMLALSVTAEIYMPADLIIEMGTSANELYVIGDGQVQVSRPDGLVVAVLGKGNFFGEMALFHQDLQRNCNVGALSICDIYRVNTSQIKPLLDENPALQREMMAIVDSRVSINANIDHKVSIGADALTVDFKLRLQKRILNLQKGAARCRSSSITDWRSPDTCSDAQRTAVTALGSAATAAAAAAQSVEGETIQVEDLNARRTRRISFVTTSSLPGGARSRPSVNEIQLGAEIAPGKVGEGAAEEEGSAWRVQFDRPNTPIHCGSRTSVLASMMSEASDRDSLSG